MNKNLIPILLIFLIGCSENPFKKKEPEVDDMVEERAQLSRTFNKRLAETKWDSEIDDCDNLLWSGILSYVGIDVELSSFLFPGDKPQRRTASPCYPGDSRSSISNDMLIGLVLSNETDVIERVYDYGKDNDFIMGDPPTGLGEVLMKPNVRIVYEMALDKDTVPTFYTPVKKDFAYHTQVLLIYAEGEIAGKLSNNAIDRLKAAGKAFPKDYLFKAIYGAYTGDMDDAIILINKGIKPSSYVRGHESYPMTNWLLAAKIALKYSK